MKEQILQLRSEGKTYTQIQEILNCSRGTISYHCGIGQIDKTNLRRFLNRGKRNSLQKQKREYLQEFSLRYRRLCGCKHCGINNPIVLQYDHIDTENKISTVSQMVSERCNISIIKDEIRKCQVLCANCHLIKTSIQLNYKNISS